MMFKCVSKSCFYDKDLNLDVTKSGSLRAFVAVLLTKTSSNKAEFLSMDNT